MPEQEFSGLSNEALARVWFALALAETHHPGGFIGLRDAAFAELGERFAAPELASYLDEHFEAYRQAASAPEPTPGPSAVPANPGTVRDSYPA